MSLRKTGLLLLVSAWFAVLFSPQRAAHAQETRLSPGVIANPLSSQADAGGVIRGMSSPGAIDGERGSVYREKTGKQKETVSGFLSFLSFLLGYLAVLLPPAVFVIYLINKLREHRGIKNRARQELAAAIKSKIDTFRTQAKEDESSLGAIGAMVCQYVKLKGDFRAFDIDELPYIAKFVPGSAPLAPLVNSLSGAETLQLAKKLFQSNELQKSAGILNAAAVNAAVPAEGGCEEVVRIYETAGRLDEFVGGYCGGQSPEFYSAYAGALMKINKYAQALGLLKLSKKLLRRDALRIFELHVRLGNFSQAEILLDEALRIKPVDLGSYPDEGAGADKEKYCAEENREFYYELALFSEGKGGNELAAKIYRVFEDAALQYRDVSERYDKLKPAHSAEQESGDLTGRPAVPGKIGKEETPGIFLEGSASPARPGGASARPMLRSPGCGDEALSDGEEKAGFADLPALGKVWLDATYEVKGEIGAGGIGVAYEGWDHSLNRKVVVKKMRRELSSCPKERKRFLREAALVARLNHPNIAGIHAVIEEDGEVYLVSEYIEGKMLSVVIKDQKQLTLKDCKSIFGNVCTAVSYAHHKNILHRDLKPDNIIVGSNDFAKVMDFGLAGKLRDRLARLSGCPAAGTLNYTAPEQYRGIALPESDIYALGICLYESLTGEMPFKGADLLDEKKRKNYKDVSLTLPSLSGKIDKIISQALEPDPKERFSDVMKFYEEFNSL